MQRIFGNEFGQAEIENLGQPAAGDEHIGRLDVAMNDAFGVGYIESVRNLNAEIEDALERQRLAMDVVAQRFAVDELHGDERLVILFADVVNGADAGVIESGTGVRFAAKALQRLGILQHVLGKEFQRDGALEPGVHGLVDHTHAAGAEFFQNAIVREGPVNHCGARALNVRETNHKV